jgi:hypothetical protein
VEPFQRASIVAQLAIECSVVARHQESIRTNMSSALIALSAALIAAAGFLAEKTGGNTRSIGLFGMGATLIALGWIGLRFSDRSYARYLVWHHTGFSLISALEPFVGDLSVTKRGSAERRPMTLTAVFSQNVSIQGRGTSDTGSGPTRDLDTSEVDSQPTRDLWASPFKVIVWIGIALALSAFVPFETLPVR